MSQHALPQLQKLLKPQKLQKPNEMLISSLILKQFYNKGSLQNTERGIEFSIQNRLKEDAQITTLSSVKIEGETASSIKNIALESKSAFVQATDISKENPIDFKAKESLNIIVSNTELAIGKHNIEISFKVTPFGKLKFTIEGAIPEVDANRIYIPRSKTDDYGEEAIKDRQNFVESFTETKIEHLKNYTFDPHICEGNCENFVGVAQVPIGLAGPLQVNGEHAQGQYLIPLATSEGTLVASYNRGIKAINLSGGAKCTVIGDAMQRAPVFTFEDARKARDFSLWIQANFEQIAKVAESTSSIAKLTEIDTYLSSKFAFLRFNYLTGDAAGQNMVGRATFAACSWILDAYQESIENFYLESNFATDKKASQINIMRTRGKRVTAECIVKRDVLLQKMRVEPERLIYHSNVANMGSILSGANNNGAHSANAITAMFIATGQDVANVAESSAGLMHMEMTKDGDLYLSITIPSLIVATYGGGTSLATQRECLEMMGCYGKNKVYKLAEIIAGVVLAGELSLAAAISASDWVSSHEQYGRNR